MSSTWVAIQKNPTSGTGLKARELQTLEAELQRHGIRAESWNDRSTMQRDLAEPGRREGLRCIVAAGGDGTVADVINRFPGIPLATLPLGTENLVARLYGIQSCGRRLADIIAADYRRTIDLGLAGERRFILMASVGFDAQVIHQITSTRRGNISKLSYLPPILHTVSTYGYPEIKLYLDDDPVPQAGRLALIANLPGYCWMLPIARSADATDGLLDIRLFQRGSWWDMLRYFLHVRNCSHEQLPDVKSFRARRIRIESIHPAPVQTDGDPIGHTSLTVEVLPNALDILVPPTDNAR